MVFPGETLGEHLRHELRWAIGLRSVRPLGYWGLVFTHGLPWALVGAAAAMSVRSLAMAVSYIVAYLVLRVGLTWLTGRWGMGDRRLGKILWLVPVRDAINFIIWIAGFVSDKIIWRGLEYRVKKGRLIPVPATSQILEPRRESISSVVS